MHIREVVGQGNNQINNGVTIDSAIVPEGNLHLRSEDEVHTFGYPLKKLNTGQSFINGKPVENGQGVINPINLISNSPIPDLKRKTRAKEEKKIKRRNM